MNRQLRKNLQAVLSSLDGVKLSLEELHETAVDEMNSRQATIKSGSKAFLVAYHFASAVCRAANSLEEVEQELLVHAKQPRTTRKRRVRR